MLVAAVQTTSQANVPANLEQVESLLREAAGRGVSLAVLPEGFAFLGRDGEKCGVSESLEGPIVARLRALAKELNLAIVAGGFAESSGEFERPFNTSVAIERDGSIVGSYRKVHLFDIELADGTSFRESKHTTPGENVVVVDLAGRRVGLSICYDVRFPELFAAERVAGAEILTVPAAFTKTTGLAHWHILLRARAIETQCYVIAAAQSGGHPGGRQTFGHSLVLDPWGRILAEVEAGPGLAVAEFDEAVLLDIRARMPLLEHRRLR